jgi:hypothetical protein
MPATAAGSTIDDDARNGGAHMNAEDALASLDELERHAPSLQAAGLIVRHEAGPLLSVEGWRATEDGLMYVDGITSPPRACQEHPSPSDDLLAVSRGRIMTFSLEQLVVLFAVTLGDGFSRHVLDVARTEDLRQDAYGALADYAGSFAHALRHVREAGDPIPTLSEHTPAGTEREIFDAEVRAKLEGSRNDGVRSLSEAALATWSDRALMT